MILADRPGLDRGGHVRQFGVERWASQLASRPDATGHLHAALYRTRRDPQPHRQAVRHFRDHRGLIGGSAISPNIRHIRARLVRSWVSHRSAISTRNALPTPSEDNARISAWAAAT